MVRDMDLIRDLMLKLEAYPVRLGGIIYFDFGDFDTGGDLNVEGYSVDQIDYHLNLIYDAGLVEGGEGAKAMNGLMFRSITWQGHDFLDSVRDPVIWDKTKKGAKAAGGFTFELLKELAKGFIKKQIEERTGVSL